MKRKLTREVKIGNVKIGNNNPIAIQSMCNTKTEDVDATVAQILRLEAAHRYLAYEGLLGDSKSLFKELNDIKKGDDILVLIGPEGGFSDKEILKAKAAGFEFVSLGRSMLRAETAAIYATSLIVAKGEE